ncbi:hypothetical protein CN633_32030, partial [Bacillus toyonensis]
TGPAHSAGWVEKTGLGIAEASAIDGESCSGGNWRTGPRHGVRRGTMGRRASAAPVRIAKSVPGSQVGDDSEATTASTTAAQAQAAPVD